MRYGRDGYSIEAAERKGRGYPQWYLDAPELFEHEYFYIEVFWDLNTERLYEGGPIPNSLIRQLITERNIDKSLENSLIRVVKELDNTYQKWVSDNRRMI